MTLNELKSIEKKKGSRRPWGLKLLSLTEKDPTIEKGFLVDGFVEEFKASKMPELEKLAFVEKWASKDEAGRYIMEEAFLCDCEERLVGRRWERHESEVRVSDHDWDDGWLIPQVAHGENPYIGKREKKEEI